jgi:hypothetical protein
MDRDDWGSGVVVRAECDEVVVAAGLMHVALCVGRMDAGLDSAEVAGEGLAAALVPLDPTGFAGLMGLTGILGPPGI